MARGARDRDLHVGVLPGFPPGACGALDSNRRCRHREPDTRGGRRRLRRCCRSRVGHRRPRALHGLDGVNAHYPALFLGGFLFFLGFDRATAAYPTLSDFKTPLLVGFFLGGLVIHGGLQGWWIGPVLSSLSETPLFIGSTLLTAFNDNALITYLATLVPDLDDSLSWRSSRARSPAEG